MWRKMTWWCRMPIEGVGARLLLLLLLGGCAEPGWKGELLEPSEGRTSLGAAVRLDPAPFQECSEPPDDAMIVRMSTSSAFVYIDRVGEHLVLDVYPRLYSELDITEDQNKFDYAVNQPYKVEWEPELYWTGWHDPLDMQLEYSEEFGYYDPSHPYFPYFFLDHWLTGSDSRPTEITDLAWWNERAFVPYTLCISHFRPDRITMMLTIDPTRSKSPKAKETPFPVTIISDWSPGGSSFAGGITVDNEFLDHPDIHLQPNYFMIVYGGVAESAVWGDLGATDTGAVE